MQEMLEALDEFGFDSVVSSQDYQTARLSLSGQAAPIFERGLLCCVCTDDAIAAPRDPPLPSDLGDLKDAPRQSSSYSRWVEG